MDGNAVADSDCALMNMTQPGGSVEFCCNTVQVLMYTRLPACSFKF